MKFSQLWSRTPPRTSTMLAGRPIPSPGRRGVAIVAIMKNEARHILDWLRFHRLAGIGDFFLYDDGSTDGTPDLARRFPDAKVTVLPWRMTGSLRRPNVHFSRQVLAYCHAIENFGGDFRWMAFIDLDEFIVPKRATSIPKALAGLEAFTNVSLPWTMFGPGEYDAAPEIPAPYAYTMRAAQRAGPLLNFKCIIDPADVTEVRVHRFMTQMMGKASASEAGVVRSYKQRSDPAFLSDAVLQLNHYYTRSRSELATKLSKGAVSDSPSDRRNAKVLEKLTLIEETAVEDRCAIDFLARAGVDGPDDFRAGRG